MKTDFSKLPREEVEARITTVLMGETPDEEARELMEFVAGDRELLRLHDELKETISLVREASEGEESVRLSEGRRETLLQAFKTVRPPELAQKREGIQWRNWAAMAAMVGLLLGGAGLVFSPPATRSSRQVAGLAEREREGFETQVRSVSKDENRPITISGQGDRKALKRSADRETANSNASSGSTGFFGGRDVSAIDAVTGLPANEPEFVGLLLDSKAVAGKSNVAEAPGKPAMAPPSQTGAATVRAGLETAPRVQNEPGQQVALGAELEVAQKGKQAAVTSGVAKKARIASAAPTEVLGEPAGNLPLLLLDDVAAGSAVRRSVGVIEARRVLEQANRLSANEKLGKNLEELGRGDVAIRSAATSAAIPQPESLTAENAFSTFSLNVSDVSFKLVAASLEKGLMPETATVRSEEFINAFDYRDPEPQGAPIGFVWERARYPFAQDRDLVRFSVKTAASGRQAGRPLNLVLLLDSSGSMERADRVRILQECLKTLAAQLRPEDTVSVVAFARTARLWVDGLPGSQASELPARVGNLTPEGGTNLEEAMKVAYETARKHFSATGINRVVLLTDGAANLGDVEPESLKKKVEVERTKGIALDCFGIGWEGLNDELLETLSRNGDGRYGFVNTPEAAASEFAGQLAGALHVAASDVKVQVEWNPKRVTAYRQIGYAKHQLTKEQFRDNTVDAAELGAAEAGNALYVVQVNAAGEGPLATVRVRFKVPGTNDYREHAWTVDYDGAAKSLENSSYTLRLAGTASAFSEWLVSSPYAAEVTTDRLFSILSGVPEHFAPDPRPTKLEWMIRQAKSLTGR